MPGGDCTHRQVLARRRVHCFLLSVTSYDMTFFLIFQINPWLEYEPIPEHHQRAYPRENPPEQIPGGSSYGSGATGLALLFSISVGMPP